MDDYPDIGSAIPLVPLGPQDLGLPAAPVAPVRPMAPTQGLDTKAKLLRLIAVGIAGGLGPGAGTGLLQGMHAADQQKQQESQRTQTLANQQYSQDQTNYEQQQRIYDGEANRRQQTLTQNITALRANAGKAKSKAEYDQQVEAFASGLQSMGFRINANFLRTAAPYVKPDVQGQALKVYETFMKANPHMADDVKALGSIAVPFDRDGDGVDENVQMLDIGVLARAIGVDEKGKAVLAPKGVSPKDFKSNADGRLEELTNQARAEGKNVDDPKFRMALQEEARTWARQQAGLDAAATRAPKDAPTGLPMQQQRRVDALSKGFDQQPAVKNTQMMSEAVGFAQSLNPNTTNPADDQALIYAFAKAMDPNSVVREGEYATVQKYAQSWAQTFGFNASRMFSNTAFLTPQARQNMKTTILAKFKAGEGQYNAIRKSYVDRINRIVGSDGESYLTDYGGAFPDTASDAQSVDPASARAKYRQRQGAR